MYGLRIIGGREAERIGALIIFSKLKTIFGRIRVPPLAACVAGECFIYAPQTSSHGLKNATMTICLSGIGFKTPSFAGICLASRPVSGSAT